MITINTLAHGLEIQGIEYNRTAFGVVSLAGFDSLTIEGVLTLSQAELGELPNALTAPIYAALEVLANEQAKRDQGELAELRAWLANRRDGYTVAHFYGR